MSDGWEGDQNRDWGDDEPTGLTAHQARKRERNQGGEEMAAIARRINLLSVDERVAMASRTDLSESEQWAIASFGQDEGVAAAVQANPTIPPKIQNIARIMDRKNRPWWRKVLRPI